MRVRGIDRIMDDFKPGHRIFLSGSGGEPTALLEGWAADPERSRDLSIVTTAVPGINSFDFAQLHDTAGITGIFMQPAFAELQRKRRFRHFPTSYAGFVRHLAADAQGFDVIVVQVAPPDSLGNCSLGPLVEFVPTALSRSARVIGLINAQTPVLPGAPTLPLKVFDRVAEVDTRLPTYNSGPIDPISSCIAKHVANLIEDGSTLQAGLGKVPSALVHALHDRRRLRIHSGMFGDGIRILSSSGALDANAKHLACVLVGDTSLYEWARQHPEFQIRGCEETHHPRAFIDMERFVAVNSAIEVDLFGQCALEHASSAAVSGAGGAPDFTRAARLCRSGLSIIALPATAARNSRSRIVARLSAPGIATVPRTDVDYVVTEHGAADLRGADVHARAEALITIAAPELRGALWDEWHTIAKRL